MQTTASPRLFPLGPRNAHFQQMGENGVLRTSSLLPSRMRTVAPRRRPPYRGRQVKNRFSSLLSHVSLELQGEEECLA